MIRRIKLNQIATFTQEVRLDDIRKVNFFFGGNGSGKTTISKLLLNPENYTNCEIEYENNRKLKTIVYNEDFVKSYFYQSENLKGIFTLGEGAEEIEKEIERKDEEIEILSNEIEGLYKTKSKKEEEKNRKWHEFKEYCWNNTYQKYKDDFGEIFAGYRKSKENLAKNILNIKQNTSSNAKSKEELKEKYDLLFVEELSVLNEVPIIDQEEIINPLITLENHSILKTNIIGKQDVDIAQMIHKLQNHDWVRQGKSYYEKNFDEKEKVYMCPFCQQPTHEGFKEQLENYFDETYERQMKELSDFIQGYDELTDKIIKFLNNILSISNNRYLEQKRKKIEEKQRLIVAKLDRNKLELDKKTERPSTIVELLKISDLLIEVNELIVYINNEIKQHNQLVNNKAQERGNLKSNIWIFTMKTKLTLKVME